MDRNDPFHRSGNAYYGGDGIDQFTVNEHMKRQTIARSALHYIGKEIRFRGSLAVIVGRYWRKRTSQILYDVRISPADGIGPPAIHCKIPEEEL